jgi:hypothetical protein
MGFPRAIKFKFFKRAPAPNPIFWEVGPYQDLNYRSNLSGKALFPRSAKDTCLWGFLWDNWTGTWNNVKLI